MAEYLDIVDENNNLTGETAEREYFIQMVFGIEKLLFGL